VLTLLQHIVPEYTRSAPDEGASTGIVPIKG
jgi:hypothetical protein